MHRPPIRFLLQLNNYSTLSAFSQGEFYGFEEFFDALLENIIFSSLENEISIFFFENV
jgi:hypothetical protein